MDGVVLAAFATGLLGSAHCVAMCGGIVGALSGGVSPDLRKRPRAHVGYVLSYNAGRVASYVLFGAVFGALALGFRHVLAEAQLALRALAGTLMLGLGLYLIGAFPKFAAIERVGAPLFARISPHARKLLPVRSHTHAVLLGALWGWIPCGMVYTALALATASGGPQNAALAMLAFGLGTLPAMLLTGTVAGHVLSRVGSTWVRRGAGVVIAAFGVMSVAFAGTAWANARADAHEHAPIACHSSQ